MTDKIWYEDIFALPRRPLEFFPAKGQTASEHANALIRLIIYVTLALTVYSGSLQTIFIGLAAIVAVTLVFRGRGNLAGYDNTAPTKCRGSTVENPFANTLVTEFGRDPLPDPPCAYDDMKDEIEKNFNVGLYRDIEDWSNRQNSQRQFVTLPTGGNPPDTRGFAEFLYGHAQNCKVDSKQCY